jgi:hypothetical protein
MYRRPVRTVRILKNLKLEKRILKNRVGYGSGSVIQWYESADPKHSKKSNQHGHGFHTPIKKPSSTSIYGVTVPNRCGFGIPQYVEKHGKTIINHKIQLRSQVLTSMSPLSPAPLIAFIWLKSTNKKTIFLLYYFNS